VHSIIKDMHNYLSYERKTKKMYRNLSGFCMNEVGSVPVTVTAFEWLCPGVLPEVSGQLVASCKTPHAALPRTPVRFLACRTNKKRGGGG